MKLKIFGTLGLVMLIAILIFPFFTGFILTGLYYFNGDKIVVEDTNVDNIELVSKQLSARDFLNISNGKAHEYKDEGHVCRHIANATLLVFDDLITKNQREELKEQVRMASSIGTNKVGHVWIEVYEDGEWVEYETTLDTPNLKIDEVQDYSYINKTKRTILSSDYTSEQAEYTSLPGTQIFIPTSKGYTSYYSTATFALYNAITDISNQFINGINWNNLV